MAFHLSEKVQLKVSLSLDGFSPNLHNSQRWLAHKDLADILHLYIQYIMLSKREDMHLYYLTDLLSHLACVTIT